MFDVPRLAKNRHSVVIEPIIPTKGQAAELALILAAPMAVWLASIERILASYNPKPETTTDSPADSDAAMQGVEQEINVLLLSVGAKIREWAIRTERWHRQKWVSSVYSATKVDLHTVMTGTAVEETLEAFIARNVALAKDVNAEAQRRIADAVYRGYIQRLHASQIAKEIRKAASMGKARSIRIAGDQNSKLSAALDKERQLEAGIRFGKYRHSGKRHPREWHKARDGKVYDLTKRVQVDEKGKKIENPDRILPEDWPGYPPFCGCRMGAYLPVEATISRRP